MTMLRVHGKEIPEAEWYLYPKPAMATAGVLYEMGIEWIIEPVDGRLADLRRTGLCRLDIVPWVDEFIEFMSWKPKFPGHVTTRPRPGIWHNRMQDVMAAPHFLGYAKSFTGLATEYFGEPAQLWSLNAFHTDEKTPYVPGVNGLHRDKEADKILCLFMFATDVDVTGAQVLLPYHKHLECWEAVWGQKGTAWLADTTHLHMGLLPQKPRTLVWARWANKIPQSKYDENLPDVI